MQQALFRGHGVTPIYREVPDPAPLILEWRVRRLFQEDPIVIVLFFLEGTFQGVPMYSCDKMN